MTTLHLTRLQYRELAEITKTFGMALTLSTYARLGCWGRYSPWAELVWKDATDPASMRSERSVITLAQAVNATHLRAAGAQRPELDWGALHDHEIFPFIVWHEIGHRMDNFDHWKIVRIDDLAIRNQCHSYATRINEVLADRYAWERIRPGAPLPLSEHGKATRDKMLSALAYLDRHAPRLSDNRRWPLEVGQYKDVPDVMLQAPARAAFVGPRVSDQLLQARIRRRAECL